ncbi:MAG: porin family protein [Mucinivorans sp.]
MKRNTYIIKVVTSLCLVILCPSIAVAQNTDKAIPKKTETKPDVPTLEAAWKPVAVDHIFGIRGGLGLGNARMEPSRNNKTLPNWLQNYGISYRFDVPAQKYVGTIEIDLQYMEKGFAYAVSFAEDNNEIYSRKYSVIEFPILWQPYFPFGKGESRVFVNLGPFLSYTLSGTERTTNIKTGEYVEHKYLYDPLRDNRVEYGVIVGGGVAIGIKRFAVTLDFRYNIALSDALKGVNNYAGNPFRSPVDQMSLSLGLQYRFIKGKTKSNE